jgi:gamma-glutamylaminecyclotransferase
MSHKLFVYGSLKRGFGNHELLKNSKFLGAYDTSDANYQMFSFGGFPGVIALDEQDRHHYILGELYEVDDATLARVDMLEGNGHFYTRKIIELSETDDIVEAWMYLLPQSYLQMEISVRESQYKVFLNERTNWQYWAK